MPISNSTFDYIILNNGCLVSAKSSKRPKLNLRKEAEARAIALMVRRLKGKDSWKFKVFSRLFRGN